MKMFVFSILDSKSRSYSQPFFSVNEAVGVRSFMGVCNDRDNLIGRNPEDFALMLLGEWDDESAQFNLLRAPRNLGLGSSFVKPLKGGSDAP